MPASSVPSQSLCSLVRAGFLLFHIILLRQEPVPAAVPALPELSLGSVSTCDDPGLPALWSEWLPMVLAIRGLASPEHPLATHNFCLLQICWRISLCTSAAPHTASARKSGWECATSILFNHVSSLSFRWWSRGSSIGGKHMEDCRLPAPVRTPES